MRKDDVQTPGAALAYLTDCTLATVIDLAGKRSAPKGELRRQISMAQHAIDWMRRFGVDYSRTRAQAVVEHYNGDVERWACAVNESLQPHD